MARPSGYSIEIATKICEELATTEHGIERICRASEEFPDPRTVYRWLAAYPAFRQIYARAREMQAEVMAAQILAIADDGSADMVTRYREDGSEYQAVDQEHIQRSRLRVDARKWLAAKLAPMKYGDVSVAGEGGGTTFVLNIRPAGSPQPAVEIQPELEAGEVNAVVVRRL